MPHATDPAAKGRRAFLKLLGAGFAAGGLARQAGAATMDPTLQALIEQNQQRDLGQDFDAASRTIHMPKASLPTLSPGTVATTQQAVGKYERHRCARRLAQGAARRSAASR